MPSPDEQLLHIVIGGDLVDTQSTKFRDLTQLHYVGAYPNYAEAFLAWRGAAQSTVDNAIRRYFILHAHKLIDPAAPPTKGYRLKQNDDGAYVINEIELSPRVKRYRLHSNETGEWIEDGAEFAGRRADDSYTLQTLELAKARALEYMDDQFGIDDTFEFTWNEAVNHELGRGWYARSTDVPGWEDEDITFFIEEVEI